MDAEGELADRTTDVLQRSVALTSSDGLNADTSTATTDIASDPGV